MRIRVSLHELSASVPVSFSEENRFEIGFKEGFPNARASPYSGSYEVIPRVSAQSLPTKDKSLDKDILVRAIPYHEVENTERGTTAIIGGV